MIWSTVELENTMKGLMVNDGATVGGDVTSDSALHPDRIKQNVKYMDRKECCFIFIYFDFKNEQLGKLPDQYCTIL